MPALVLAVCAAALPAPEHLTVSEITCLAILHHIWANGAQPCHHCHPVVSRRHHLDVLGAIAKGFQYVDLHKALPSSGDDTIGPVASPGVHLQAQQAYTLPSGKVCMVREYKSSAGDFHCLALTPLLLQEWPR